MYSVWLPRHMNVFIRSLSLGFLLLHTTSLALFLEKNVCSKMEKTILKEVKTTQVGNLVERMLNCISMSEKS